MRLYKNLIKAGMLGFIFAWAMTFGFRAESASAKFVPKLFIGYNYNDNVGSVDPDLTDPVMMQWVDYLVGIDASVKSQYTLLTLGGSAGYSQYVDASTELKDLYDTSPSRFDYYNISLNGSFQYIRPDFALEIADRVIRNRLISEIFQTEISELSDIYLYTDNVASAGVRFRVGQPLSFLFRYEYETLIFENPEIDVLTQPSDMTRHSGFARIGYQISPRAEIALDLQGGQIVYDDIKIEQPDAPDLEMKIADFNYYQALLGFGYRFTPNTTIQVSGGAEQREYFGEPEGRDLENTLLPVGRVSFTSAQKDKYNLTVSGEYSQSKFGQNLFFTYYQGSASFTYYFGKTLYASAGFIYKNDTFDRDRLDLNNVWSDDRQDQLYIGQGSITWDALKKYDTPYLSFIAKYIYSLRDSNIDGELSDYVDNYPGVYYSYDTEIQMAMFQVSFNPAVFIGSSK